MFKKSLILVGICFLLLSQWSLYGGDPEPMNQKTKGHMDKMDTKFSERNPVIVNFNNPYGLVTFNHEAHTSFSCSDCHPPFVFNFDDEMDFSLRAHKHCLGCHEGSSVDTSCTFCHVSSKNNTIAFEPTSIKSKSPERQKILDFFYKRRSIRSFQKKPVPRDIIDDLLKAGMAAPSAHNWQPWIFIVVDDPKIKKTLSESSPFAGYIKTAPYVIVIAGKKNNYWAKFDCAVAAENILLAATHMGLGSVYCGLDDERWEKAKTILNVPETYEGYSYLPIGYPNEEKPAYTKYDQSKIYRNKFEKGRPESVLTDKPVPPKK
ncbi:Nitroreductase-like protein [Candidatus Magnetomorum sp. HK-1]|nr:Nitroreductase-like protein [Candidatus Magnetomorum sp. HK-1]